MGTGSRVSNDTMSAVTVNPLISTAWCCGVIRGIMPIVLGVVRDMGYLTMYIRNSIEARISLRLRATQRYCPPSRVV